MTKLKIGQFKSEIYLALLYRIFIIFLIYTLTRIFFYLYNIQHFELTSNELLKILLGGIRFDTTAILYTNLLFIFLSIIPFKFRHNKNYQQILKYIFFTTNGIALMTNFVDIPYYEFVLERTTISIFEQFKNETNLPLLFLGFIFEYWPISLMYIAFIGLMIFLYNRCQVKEISLKKPLIYYTVYTVIALASIALTIGGIRGDFKHSTRPLTLSDAGQYVKTPNEMAIVLNTPFCLIRSTEGAYFTRQNFYNDSTLNHIYSLIHFPKPAKNPTTPNVVIIIVESLNKEFIGKFYPDLDNGQYKGYSPFLDSLVDYSYTFKYSFANGRKSIDALPSIIASIPSIEAPFVLSNYYNNHMTTLPLLLKEIGYKSAFFHGAPNGSMGLLAFSKLAGFDEYYGKNEYNNDNDFDGIWGIWDEEFLQYMAHTLDTFTQPFFATVFTVTSHHPFRLPSRYDSVFKSVDFPLQRCIEYTDYAIKRFFETSKKMKWFENTLFVITADHVSINQREEFKNPMGYFSVPIIFYQPENKLVGFDTTTIAQQIDILPTILYFIGYNKPFISFGQNLFSTPINKFAVNYLNGTYRLYSNDYVIEYTNNKIVGLYNFKKDSQFRHNLINSKNTYLKPLENLLKAFIQQYKNNMIDNTLTWNNQQKKKASKNH